jgi:predicted TPR repeat methyltransferase
MQQRLVPPETPRVWDAAHRGSDATRGRALRRLADILFVAGDFRGAAIAARRSLALDASSSRGAVIAVSALMRAGQHEQASQTIADVLRDHGKRAWAGEFRQRFITPDPALASGG